VSTSVETGGMLGVVSFWGWPSIGARVGSNRRAAPGNHRWRGGSSPMRLVGRPRACRERREQNPATPTTT